MKNIIYSTIVAISLIAPSPVSASEVHGSKTDPIGKIIKQYTTDHQTAVSSYKRAALAVADVVKASKKI